MTERTGKVISAQVEGAVHEALQAEAQRQERTVSWLVNNLLKKMLVKPHLKQPPKRNR